MISRFHNFHEHAEHEDNPGLAVTISVRSELSMVKTMVVRWYFFFKDVCFNPGQFSRCDKENIQIVPSNRDESPWEITIIHSRSKNMHPILWSAYRMPNTLVWKQDTPQIGWFIIIFPLNWPYIGLNSTIFRLTQLFCCLICFPLYHIPMIFLCILYPQNTCCLNPDVCLIPRGPPEI